MDSVDWLWIGGTIGLHRGFMCEFLISFIELEKQFILLNIFMKLRTRLLRISKREKQAEYHATWIEFSFEMRSTTKFVLQRLVRKVENWDSELTSYL